MQPQPTTSNRKDSGVNVTFDIPGDQALTNTSPLQSSAPPSAMTSTTPSQPRRRGSMFELFNLGQGRRPTWRSASSSAQPTSSGSSSQHTPDLSNFTSASSSQPQIASLTTQTVVGTTLSKLAAPFNSIRRKFGISELKEKYAPIERSIKDDQQCVDFMGLLFQEFSTASLSSDFRKEFAAEYAKQMDLATFRIHAGVLTETRLRSLINNEDRCAAVAFVWLMDIDSNRPVPIPRSPDIDHPHLSTSIETYLQDNPQFIAQLRACKPDIEMFGTYITPLHPEPSFDPYHYQPGEERFLVLVHSVSNSTLTELKNAAKSSPFGIFVRRSLADVRKNATESLKGSKEPGAGSSSKPQVDLQTDEVSRDGRIIEYTTRHLATIADVQRESTLTVVVNLKDGNIRKNPLEFESSFKFVSKPDNKTRMLSSYLQCRLPDEHIAHTNFLIPPDDTTYTLSRMTGREAGLSGEVRAALAPSSSFGGSSKKKFELTASSTQTTRYVATPSDLFVGKSILFTPLPSYNAKYSGREQSWLPQVYHSNSATVTTDVSYPLYYSAQISLLHLIEPDRFTGLLLYHEMNIEDLLREHGSHHYVRVRHDKEDPRVIDGTASGNIVQTTAFATTGITAGSNSELRKVKGTVVDVTVAESVASLSNTREFDVKEGTGLPPNLDPSVIDQESAVPSQGKIQQWVHGDDVS